MSRLSGLLAFFFVLPSLIPAGEPLPVPKESQVLIARATGDKTAYGTGSAIAYEDEKTLVLTNAHVALDAKAGHKVYFRKTEYTATYLAGQTVTETVYYDGQGIQRRSQDFEDDVDLALIEVGVEIPLVPIAKKNARVGDNLRQWGFSGFGGNVNAAPGHKTGTVTDWSGQKHTGSTLPAAPGDSGSGLFNDLGELTGVVAWGKEGDPKIATIGMSTETIRSFLKKKLGTKYPLLRAKLGGVVEMPIKP